MKQAAKKTQKKADMQRSRQLKNSSQEASSQEDPKEGSQETSSQETSSPFARFLHAFWKLLRAFFGSRRANPLQETKRFMYSLSSSWDLFRKNITITLWSRFDHAWITLGSRLITPDYAWSRLIPHFLSRIARSGVIRRNQNYLKSRFDCAWLRMRDRITHRDHYIKNHHPLLNLVLSAIND